MEMKWWDKMMIPMRKVWAKVSKRIVLRKTGIVKLRQDIQTCEYEDVHILWEMLKRNETTMGLTRKETSWKFQWAKYASCLKA